MKGSNLIPMNLKAIRMEKRNGVASEVEYRWDYPNGVNDYRATWKEDLLHRRNVDHRGLEAMPRRYILSRATR